MYPTIDQQETGDNIKKLLINRGISIRQLQEYLGLACVQTIYHWLEGKAVPSVDNLYAMCDLFQVSMDEVVGGSASNRSKFKKDFLNRCWTYQMGVNKILYEEEFY